MYRFFFNGCLVTLGIGTLLGVASVWVPEGWEAIGSKLLWTDSLLFCSTIVGALLCKLGDV